MSLTSGTRLGVYEVVSALGAGGMGEVYRARDTKLGREVALKVVSESFTYDPERVARFQREAQLLAALNHPHIASIHGLEDVTDVGAGFSRPVQFLIMELVEGGTLADRLTSGPIPVDEALAIARQVADALQAAHEKGIIHRDLKPANIAFTADGQVKVLDFGLAKALEPSSGSAIDSPAFVTHSPTLSLAATQAGVILGTAAYMAPEQARGKPADKRSDIWAFGCVLYEMLTGTRAFEGEDASETMAFVMARDADLSAIPGHVPPAIRVLLRRCLEKDRRKRLADAAAAIVLIEEAPALVTPAPPDAAAFEQERASLRREAEAAASAKMARPARRRLTLVGGAALFLGAAAAGTPVWLATRPVPPRVERFTIEPRGAAALSFNGNDRDLAITPDGSRIVYAGDNGTQLFVRAFDQLEPTPLVRGTGLRIASISPDGQWVAFVDNNTSVRKVAISGGPAVPLATIEGASRGATWMPDDTIIFAGNTSATGLLRVSAAGGEVTTLTRPDRERGEADHFWPEALPGGRQVLFTITAVTGGLDAAQIAVLDLETAAYRVLLRGGSDAHYVPTGHLVYTAGGTLRAVGFDLDRIETRGTPVPVLPRLVTTTAGAGDFGLAGDGTLVFADAPGVGSLAARTLVWVDRQGLEQALAAPPRAYAQARVSPDGTRVALWIADQENDIWVWDLTRATLTRLTFDSNGDQHPIWTPDSRQILFASQRTGVFNVYRQAADGTGAPERLTESTNGQFPTGLSPDGARLVIRENRSSHEMLMVTLDAQRQVQPLVQTSFNERNGDVSPDGRWLAYESDSSGRLEIYVRPFPNVGDGQWQTSTSGGTRPLWARNGQELFYVAPDGALMGVRVDARGTTWSAGTPARILEGGFFTGAGNSGRTYDVSPDGQRFLTIKQAGADQSAAPPQIVVVKNWFEELKRLVPVD